MRQPLLTLPQALAALECSESELHVFVEDGKVTAADGRFALTRPQRPWVPGERICPICVREDNR